MVKHWFDVFHTCNYKFVRNYEVWLHLSYIYVNNDEIGMPKTKKIKTFQSKKKQTLNFSKSQYSNTLIS